jgi:hypothetical protein
VVATPGVEYKLIYKSAVFQNVAGWTEERFKNTRQFVDVPANAFLETFTSVSLLLLFSSILPSIEVSPLETAAFVAGGNFNSSLFHSHLPPNTDKAEAWSCSTSGN